MPGELIRKKADLIDRFMRAYVRAMHRARNDREFTIKSLAKYTTVTDPVLLGKTYDFYVGKVVERAPYINMVGMQNALDDLARTIPAAKTAKPEQFVDMRFLDRLRRVDYLKNSIRINPFARFLSTLKVVTDFRNPLIIHSHHRQPRTDFRSVDYKSAGHFRRAARPFHRWLALRIL